MRGGNEDPTDYERDEQDCDYNVGGDSPRRDTLARQRPYPACDWIIKGENLLRLCGDPYCSSRRGRARVDSLSVDRAVDISSINARRISVRGLSSLRACIA